MRKIAPGTMPRFWPPQAILRTLRDCARLRPASWRGSISGVPATSTRRYCLIGAGSLAAIIVVVLAVSRNRDDGNSPPPSPPAVASPAQTATGASGQTPAATAAAAVKPQDVTPPSFDVVRINPQGETVIAGRAAPNAEVTVLDGDTVIGKVTA